MMHRALVEGVEAGFWLKMGKDSTEPASPVSISVTEEFDEQEFMQGIKDKAKAKKEKEEASSKMAAEETK